jgi:hypothetical protein
MLKRLLLPTLLITAALLIVAQAQSPTSGAIKDGRDADRAAIRAHIESICRAFLDGDIRKIHDTHSEDWRGFLESSRTPIRGIDEYMKANGLPWPAPANAPKPARNSDRGFRLEDFDVIFYNPELAVANFNLDFWRKSGETLETTIRYRILDVYAKRGGHWIQVASHTVIHPEWTAMQNTMPATLPPQVRQRLLESREAVWRAWFANDQAKLDQLIPAELIAINSGENWDNRASTLAGAKGFAESGGKLVRLEFPRTEIQAYGRTFIIYTTYLFETELNGKREVSSGRATEIFVLRDGQFVNTGWHLDSGK